MTKIQNQMMTNMEIFMSLNGQLTHLKTNADLPEEPKEEEESDAELDIDAIQL